LFCVVPLRDTRKVRKNQRALSLNLSAFDYALAIFLDFAREGGVSLVNLLFGYSGRINRMQYWLGSFGAGFAIGVVTFIVVFMLMSASSASKDAMLFAGPAGLVFIGLVMLVAGYIQSALAWKRFHDRGRPGWLSLAPMIPLMMILVTVASGVASNAPPQDVIGPAYMWMMLIFPINLWFFIDLGCLPGQAGPNKYGDPPAGGGGYMPAAPRTPAAPTNAAPVSAMSSLFGAQSAMERAIAEQARATVAPRPAMASAGVAAGAGGAPSFGRKAR